MYLQFLLISFITLKTGAEGSHYSNLFKLGIVGGEPTRITNAAWFAVIERNIKLNDESSQLIFYGGSIISKNIVITAAFCLQDMRIEDALVRVGANHFNTGGMTYSLRAYGIHPQYDPNLSRFRDSETFGIGIIWLENDIGLSFVQYISLPDFEYTLRNNTEGMVCGFGQTGYMQSITRNLHCVNLTTVPCEEHYNITVSPNSSTDTICVGTFGRNICYRDIGGGLVVDDKLVAVAIASLSCGNTGHPSVFSKLNSLKSWIGDSQRNFGSYIEMINFIFTERLNVYGNNLVAVTYSSVIYNFLNNILNYIY